MREQCKQKDKYLILSALALPIVLSISSAWAKKTPETYSAVEDETSEAAVPTLQKTAAKKRASSQKALKSPQGCENKLEKTAYDPVPSEQVELIAHRLKLIEVLLRKYGRAYDYRGHTIKDLETILAGLEAAASAQAPTPAAPIELAAPASGEAAPEVL